MGRRTKLKVRRDDILMSLDGVLYIEGSSGAKVSKIVKDDKRRALGMLRTLVPGLTARQVTVDPLGRVRINHPKYAEGARVLAADGKADVKAVGKVFSRPRIAAARAVSFDINVICANDFDSELDVVCGEFDWENDECETNYFCGWS